MFRSSGILMYEEESIFVNSTAHALAIVAKEKLFKTVLGINQGIKTLAEFN